MRTFNRLHKREIANVNANKIDQFAHVPKLTKSYLSAVHADELLALAYILETKKDEAKLEKVNAELSRR